MTSTTSTCPKTSSGSSASALHPQAPKTLRERFFHALAFELIAIALCAPLGAWLLGHSLAHMGLLTLMVSLIAMAWNMLFNALFDGAQKRLGFTRTLGARVVHSVLFEIGLIVAVVPLAAWWLDIGLWEALVLDIGIVLFFLPYTFIFNWVYDHLRQRRHMKSQAAARVTDRRAAAATR